MTPYLVKGFAFVPVEVQIVVEAGNSRQAITIAKRKFKADKTAHIISNSEDYAAAFDWRPTAEKVSEIAAKPRQDRRALAPEFVARVLRNPTGFLKMAIQRGEVAP